MKTLRICLLLLTLPALGGCSRLSEFSLRMPKLSKSNHALPGIDQIAIVDVVGDIHSEVVKNQVSDFFTEQLLRRDFSPIVRDYVQHELNLKDFQRANMTDEAYAVQAGRAIDVPAVLIVSVPTFGAEMSMNAKLLDVGTGGVLWYGHAMNREKKHKRLGWFGRSEDPFADQFGSQYDALLGAGSEAAYEMTEKDLLEVALTLEDEKRVASLVSSICRDLPERAEPMLDPVGPQPNLWAGTSPAPTPAPYEYAPAAPAPRVEEPAYVEPPMYAAPPTRPDLMAARTQAPTSQPQYREPTYVEPEYMRVAPPPAMAPTAPPVRSVPMEAPVTVTKPAPVYAPIPKVPEADMVPPTIVAQPRPMYPPVRSAPEALAPAPLQPLVEIAPARRVPAPQPGLSQVDAPIRPRRESLLDLAPPRVAPQVEPRRQPVVQPRPEPRPEAPPQKKKKKKFHWTDLL